jgi:hypothetical protein
MGKRMMHEGMGVRAASADRLKQRLRIRWGDLGCPTEPCILEYQGELIEIRQSEIDAAKANPDVVFTASRFQTWTGPSYYRLGILYVPQPTSAKPRKQAALDKARVLIRWGDLGSPTEPGTFNYRGMIVAVQHKDIAAARSNPDAIFSASQIRPHSGRSYYVLGKVELAAVSTEKPLGL